MSSSKFFVIKNILKLVLQYVLNVIILLKTVFKLFFKLKINKKSFTFENLAEIYKKYWRNFSETSDHPVIYKPAYKIGSI